MYKTGIKHIWKLECPSQRNKDQECCRVSISGIVWAGAGKTGQMAGKHNMTGPFEYVSLPSFRINQDLIVRHVSKRLRQKLLVQTRTEITQKFGILLCKISSTYQPQTHLVPERSQISLRA